MLSYRHLSVVDSTSAITSIVLFALVNANYNFLFEDVGCQGRILDGGVFRNHGQQEKMEKDSLGFPPPTPLTGRKKPVPYFLVAEEAFTVQKVCNEILVSTVSEGIN
jgi:hypothetical protein